MSIRTKTTHHIQYGLIAACFFVLPVQVFAAILSLDPPAGKFGPGDTFILTVRLDTAPSECINAAAVELTYPTDWMKAVAVSNGESLFTLWPEEPSVDLAAGVIRFEGGIPGGYCGRIQGDPEKTNILAKVIFSLPGNMIGGKTTTVPEQLSVTFGGETRVLLNDGWGTAAPLTLRSGSYTRELLSRGLPNEWLDVIHEDTVPPDLFTIALEHDKNTFQGKYFIVFSTVDKQSGVHHYEVAEDDPVSLGYTRGKLGEKALFVTVPSPYVLRDQSLGSRIIVRAYDHAGNVQEAILPPQDRSSIDAAFSDEGGSSERLRWYVGGAALLLCAAIVGWILYRRRHFRV
jgi:hypothetical protein